MEFVLKPIFPDENVKKKDFNEFQSIEEEKLVINTTEIDNKCFDDTIKEEIENAYVKGETMEDVGRESEQQFQNFLKSEELIIKDEEDDHEPDDVDICFECTVIVAVNDNPVLMKTIDRAIQTVPKGTLILRSSYSGLGIYSLRHLKKGVRLGPYEGQTIKVVSAAGYSWKLSDGRLVDTNDETSSNYLRYVNYAKELSEQNLVAFQSKGDLYYRTCRDIEKGEELLIYFDGNTDKTYYEPNEENFDDEFYICQFCQLGFEFEAHRNRHQMFCKIRTNDSCVGYLCKHFTISRGNKCADEDTQNELVESTRKYIDDYCIDGTNQKLKRQQKNIQCTDWDYKTYCKYILKHHRKKHDPTKMFKCTYCDYETHLKWNLNKHIQKHESTHVFKCPDCDYATYYKYNLNLHRQKHKMNKMFKCADCDYETYYKSNLNQHRRKHEPTKMFKCADCDFETSYKNSLEQHTQKHKPTKMFKCTDCDYKTYLKKNLRQHIKKHKPTNLFKCTYCDYETHCKSYLNNIHKQKHESTQNFKCADCDYKTNLKSCLNQHKQKHELTKLFKCADCDYETPFKTYMNQHKLKHEPMLKCTDCDFKTFYNRTLTSHRRKHEGMLKCAYCDYETVYKNMLKIHRQKHELAKMFKCSDCEYETLPE